MAENVKQALILAVYGSRRQQAFDSSYGEIQKSIENYVSTEVFMAVFDRKRQGENPGETAAGVISSLTAAGYRKAVVMPLFMISGETLRTLKSELTQAAGQDVELTFLPHILGWGADALADMLALEYQGEQLLLCAHGSANSMGNDDYEKLADLVRARGLAADVYMIHHAAGNFGAPNLPHLDRSKHVTIVPIFITSGFHVERDIKGTLMETFAADGWDAGLGKPCLSEDPGFISLLVDKAKDSLQQANHA
ncbi:MAG: CbiX/SirB N-terminal domain-containing protein [Eubacteriales bacterium]|nr:CbiX/SirB N-terminal domain-containing protein [Eubacteriales bacterium]